MPVWNGEKYLRVAIESILNQTFRDFEFLILDDGSTDSTPQILAEYAHKDARIRIIPLDHQGIVIALNRGVAEASAEWIARMDCDDIARPQRLAFQWQAVQARPDAVLCHTQIHIMGDAPYVTPAARFIRSEALIRLRLCYQCPFVHSTIMFRKDAVLACGGYLPEERHAEDFGLWGRLILQGAVVGCPAPLLDFRVHQDSISKRKLDVQIDLSQMIALRHCRHLLHLDEKEARRALNALRFYGSTSSLRDWFWLVTHCLPRLECQSVELWIWVLWKTLVRLRHAIGKQ
jgi:glycosyltransferase involved in cell wall biosynthesis